MQKPKVHIYSVYKQIETPVLICYELIQNAVVCPYSRYEDLHISCDRIVIVLMMALRALFNLYFTHIVWSADLCL